jgi:hypothetical protein
MQHQQPPTPIPHCTRHEYNTNSNSGSTLKHRLLPTIAGFARIHAYLLSGYLGAVDQRHTMAQKHSGFFADFVKCEFRPAHGGRFNVWEELPGTTRPIIEGFTARIQYAPKAQRQRIAMDMVTKRATGKSPPYKPKVIVVYECRTGNDRRPDDVVSKALEAFVASALDNLRLKPKRDKDAHTLEQILRGQVALRWFDRDQAIGDDYITWRFSQDWQPPIKRRTPVDDASVVYELGSRVESGKPPKADIVRLPLS